MEEVLSADDISVDIGCSSTYVKVFVAAIVAIVILLLMVIVYQYVLKTDGFSHKKHK